MRPLLTLPFAVAALVAQAPAPQTLAQKVASESKAIEALRAENPLEAFNKAKALLPATKPAFNKGDSNDMRSMMEATYGSIREWQALIEIHRLIYNTAIAAGRFEDAKSSVETARELAKEMHVEALGPFGIYRATWAKVADEASKALEELKTIEAVEEKTRTPQQVERLAFLKTNEITFQNNSRDSKRVLTSLDTPIKNLEAQTHDFDAPIAKMEKRLKDETDDQLKFKGDKAKYAMALVNSVGLKPENKEVALASLYRAQYLDPSNKEIQKYIDYLQGKGPAPKVKAASKAAKAKKK